MPPPRLPPLAAALSFLVFLTMFGQPTATALNTFDIGYGTASVIASHTLVFRLRLLFSVIFSSFLGFLQRNVSWPPWTIMMVVAAIIIYRSPPRTVAALGNAFTAVVDAFAHLLQILLDHRLATNSTVVALRKEAADFRATAQQLVAPVVHKRAVDDSVYWQQESASHQSKAAHWHDKSMTLQSDLDGALSEIECLRSSLGFQQRIRLEQQQERKMQQLDEVIANLCDRLTTAESERDLWKSQCQQHDCSKSPSARRAFGAELDSLRADKQQLKATQDSLQAEKQRNQTTIYNLQRDHTMFDNVKGLMLDMTETGSDIEKAAAVICYSFILASGVDITELGVNPLQRQTYFDWAVGAIAGHSGTLRPTTGLRLESARYPLSRSFTYHGEHYSYYEHHAFPSPSGPRPQQSPPQPPTTGSSGPGQALTGSSGDFPTTPSRGSQILQPTSYGNSEFPDFLQYATKPLEPSAGGSFAGGASYSSFTSGSGNSIFSSSPAFGGSSSNSSAFGGTSSAATSFGSGVNSCNPTFGTTPDSSFGASPSDTPDTGTSPSPAAGSASGPPASTFTNSFGPGKSDVELDKFFSLPGEK